MKKESAIVLGSRSLSSCNSIVRESNFMISHMIQDHAGHILGVDSIPMIEKLEQYNGILEVRLFLI